MLGNEIANKITCKYKKSKTFESSRIIDLVLADFKIP